MKTSIKNLFLLLVLLASVFFLIPTGPVTAQTFTVLHSFTADSTNVSGVYTNSDGANPLAGLILSGNTLYGTSQAGGGSGAGTVFKVNADGTGFTTLSTFSGGSDAANPGAGLVLSGNALYGTTFNTFSGAGLGTVFKLNTDGTGFTNLYTFSRFANSGTRPPSILTADAHPEFKRFQRNSNEIKAIQGKKMTPASRASLPHISAFSVSASTTVAPNCTDSHRFAPIRSELHWIALNCTNSARPLTRTHHRLDTRLTLAFVL